MVPHIAELKALVEHQTRQGRVVSFQMRISPGESQPVGIYALETVEAADPEAMPLVVFRDVEPFVAWTQSGYVRVNADGLTPYAATFRLTEHGMWTVWRLEGRQAE